ncbi:MAG: DUF4832 domain-containing protein [Lachnospiraceae bacterium]|nr:DUF4832 domain-containing protein [Lachnospiraceae bacterium]MCM1239454.1 DUF4832 domain-containing protein [Lachnospiraceae bacterium]
MKKFLTRSAICLFILAVISASGVLLYRCGNGLLAARGHGDVELENCVFTESDRQLYNPNRGFYHMHGFHINDEETDFRQNIADRFCRDEDTMLTMIEFNLQTFRDRPISEQGLENLEALFQALEQVDKRLIVRFLYDWNGENEQVEPENIDVILEHIRQVGPTLRKYKDRIFAMQGLFIGNWGEMNGTEYSDPQSMQMLAEELMNATDPSTFLSVRMPMQWRMVTRLGEVSGVARGDGTLASRLGLFNDGMLGSWSDYGTYGEHTREEDGDFTYWSREEELEFQEELCKMVPIGGEVIVDNSYNDFENALQDMKRMHVTYLNKDFDRNVLDKWAAHTVTEEGCFQGMDGLSYMERHLGYRLLISETVLDYQFAEDTLSADVTLRNVGFAPLYHGTDTWIVLKETDSGIVHYYPVDCNLGVLTGGNDAEQSYTVHVELMLNGKAEGDYEIYFDIRDAASGERIFLANEQDPEACGYRVGTAELMPVGELKDYIMAKLRQSAIK